MDNRSQKYEPFTSGLPLQTSQITDVANNFFNADSNYTLGPIISSDLHFSFQNCALT